MAAQQEADGARDSLSDLGRAFLEVLEGRKVASVFQPVVDLRSSEVVGYEAFARGPEGSGLHRPKGLFSQAAELGRSVELDWVCRAAAYRGFLDADLPGSLSLFVNVDHPSVLEECPPDLLHLVGQAESSLRVFLEINDRALATDPAGLMATVTRAREMGWGISVDDAGTSLGCLSVLPLVRPDVVKIDVRSLGAPDDLRRLPPVVTVVMRHVEATGGSLTFKGIESDADIQLARAAGARYGQGNHLGTPGSIDGGQAPCAVVPLVGRRVERRRADSPRDFLSEVPAGHTTRDAARQVATVLTERALSAGSRPVVLTGSGPWRELEWSTRTNVAHEMASLATASALVASFEIGADPEPAPGVRGIRLPAADPLANQAFLVVLTEHLAVAMVAEPAPGIAGGIDLKLTQDPGVVTDIAHHLISRVPPPGPANTALPPPAPEPLEDWTQPDEDPPAPALRPSSLWSRVTGRG